MNKRDAFFVELWLFVAIAIALLMALVAWPFMTGWHLFRVYVLRFGFWD